MMADLKIESQIAASWCAIQNMLLVCDLMPVDHIHIDLESLASLDASVDSVEVVC